MDGIKKFWRTFLPQVRRLIVADFMCGFTRHFKLKPDFKYALASDSDLKLPRGIIHHRHRFPERNRDNGG